MRLERAFLAFLQFKTPRMYGFLKEERMYRIPSVAVFVSTTSRRTLAYFCDFPMSNGDILFSPDGDSYWPVKHQGIFGTHSQHDIRVVIPADDQEECLLVRRGKAITCGTEQYVLQDGLVVDMADMVGVPQRRRPECLLRMPNGSFIFVSAEVSSEDPSQAYRVFVGSTSYMQRVKIKPGGVTRTDDGRLVILTVEKTLFVVPPSAVRPGTPLVPGWGSAELEHATPEDYDITEWLCGDITIEKRKP